MSGLPSQRREQQPSSTLPPSASVSLAAGLVLSPARTGDHLAVHQLLFHIFRGPSASEFQLQQEEPGYSPANRFVVRQGPRIVGHARVSFRDMQIGSGWRKVARVFDVCVLPELRGQRVASALILACEAAACEQGAVLLQTRATRPSVFERQSWFPLGRHCYHLIGPRELLAEVERRKWEQAGLHQASDDLPQLSRPQHPLTVRRWKQTEHAAVQRLYGESIGGINGLLARSDDHWRWLISRSAYDWFYVAIDGPDRTLFDEIQGHIVGYAFLKANRVVELMASPANDRAAQALLVRSCRDAIEQSATPLRLDAPPSHRLHDLLTAAGCKSIARDTDGGETCLGKVLDWPQLASAILVDAGDLRLSLELRDESSTVPLRRESASPQEPQRFRIEAGQLLPEQSAGRPQVVCSAAVLAQVLLGHTPLSEALEAKQMHVANQAAHEALERWLISRPLWFAPLEDLLAE